MAPSQLDASDPDGNRQRYTAMARRGSKVYPKPRTE
jgi:hypothetical protein